MALSQKNIVYLLERNLTKMTKRKHMPDFLFECSWEVCNKVGGIYTVLSTKALTLSEELSGKHFVIGPDFWLNTPNPDFLEDKSLYPDWINTMKKSGLNVRIGYWNILGKPIALLVDFKPLRAFKDQYFASFWEKYNLDSIHGHDEYIDSAMFGVAAGKIVESYYKFFCKPDSEVIAHFHEWMTGSGILYLKHAVPKVATVFTTHATFPGRSIAGNGMPLYDPLSTYNGEEMAKRLHIDAQFSLEQKAAQFADSFTTVSDITSRECQYLLNKPVDLVTPNGFEDDFVPKNSQFTKKRKIARDKFKEVSESLLGTALDDDTIYLATSGRYEFMNKGIDVYIDALKTANHSGDVKKRIIAFVLTPADASGPRTDLVDAIRNRTEHNNVSTPLSDPCYTHYLNQKEHDPIVNRVLNSELVKVKNGNVNLIFVPAYLNGTDGIFNLPYYDLLIGFDLTVFPSYYEPWGYTPLESVAFHVPTVTTSLAGFGVWISEHVKSIADGAEVLDRNDHNYHDVVHNLGQVIVDFSKFTETEITTARSKASKLAKLAKWDNLIEKYYETYNLAMESAKNREKINKVQSKIYEMDIHATNLNSPMWKDLTVVSIIPEELKGLEELAYNLWYVWNYQAGDLFEKIDEDVWNKYANPVIVLERTSASRYDELLEDEAFMKEFKAVYSDFQAYMKAKPKKGVPTVSYFSMEFGLTDIVKIYSGGLGVLAGDYLKEASDCNVPMTAIGLLYTYGYFTQTLSMYGEQQAIYEAQNFSLLPIKQVLDKDGNQVHFTLPLPGRELNVRLWKIQVGRLDLVLLDTNMDGNSDQDRSITHQLYGGDWENRLKQEIVLGIGGIKALEVLGIKNEVYHCNEGHAAFINLARLDKYINEEGLSYKEAMEVVRASSLFTTHTPVPAGHDSFEEGLLRSYMYDYPGKLKLSWEDFMTLGQEGDYINHGEKFSMSNLAAKTSQEMNGVSWLHGKVSQDMFKGLWKGYFPEELHLGYVTNGVHYGTWTASEWRKLYESNFGKSFLSDLSNTKIWGKIRNVPDKDVWDTKNYLKQKLVEYIKERFEQDWLAKQGDPSRVIQLLEGMESNVLTIGFGRRFATYKRAHLLFNDLDRLSKIVNNPDRPVHFLFTGKAHPADGGGQGLIKHVVEISRRPEFLGKIIFLENYDMRLARRLIAGVDIWLNTPTRPLEASGTSGQKAELNGTLNFSVLDGWWLEGYIEGAGWALTDKRTYENQAHQDELDAATIYTMLENEIAPTYYDRNADGVPEKWVEIMKNSIADIAPRFTTKRMLDDYLEKFYNKQYTRTLKLKAKDYKLAKDIVAWKEKALQNWDAVEVVSVKLPTDTDTCGIGEDWDAKVELKLNELKPEDVGLEFVVVGFDESGHSFVKSVYPFEISPNSNGITTYVATSSFENAGHYKIAIRMFLTHPELPHRQDLSLVKWI